MCLALLQALWLQPPSKLLMWHRGKFTTSVTQRGMRTVSEKIQSQHFVVKRLSPTLWPLAFPLATILTRKQNLKEKKKKK